MHDPDSILYVTVQFYRNADIRGMFVWTGQGDLSWFLLLFFTLRGSCFDISIETVRAIWTIYTTIIRDDEKWLY